MEIDWDESDATWDTLPGAERIWRLFGFFPTMSEATLAGAEVDSESKSLNLTVTFSEVPREGFVPEAASLSCRVSFQFGGVAEAEIGIEDRAFEHVAFARVNEDIRTSLVQPAFEGYIISRSVAVTSVEVLERPDVESVSKLVLR